MKDSKTQQWSFQATCPRYEIDIEDIRSHLTKKHPLAFIEVNGKEGFEGFVLIHDSLVQKAYAIGNKETENTVILEYKDDFKYWVKWARKIKRADWPYQDRNPGTVTVTLKEI